jgi:hypothetical protein
MTLWLKGPVNLGGAVMTITAIRGIALSLGLLCIPLLSAGCASSGGERTVFANASGFRQGDRAVTPIDVVDLGLPELRNLTDHHVRLSQVKLVSAPKAIHLRSVTAYVYPRTGGLIIGFGDLLRRCRKTDRPYPVTVAEAPPYGYANWQIVFAFTVSKPGRYYLGRAKSTTPPTGRTAGSTRT